jgi:hypothetical protein
MGRIDGNIFLSAHRDARAVPPALSGGQMTVRRVAVDFRKTLIERKLRLAAMLLFRQRTQLRERVGRIIDIGRGVTADRHRHDQRETLDGRISTTHDRVGIEIFGQGFVGPVIGIVASRSGSCELRRLGLGQLRLVPVSDMLSDDGTCRLNLSALFRQPHAILGDLDTMQPQRANNFSDCPRLTAHGPMTCGLHAADCRGVNLRQSRKVASCESRKRPRSTQHIASRQIHTTP